MAFNWFQSLRVQASLADLSPRRKRRDRDGEPVIVFFASLFMIEFSRLIYEQKNNYENKQKANKICCNLGVSLVFNRFGDSAKTQSSEPKNKGSRNRSDNAADK